MRMKLPDPFYRSTRWKHLRGAVRARDGWMCQECKRFGRRVDADTVHHVFPRTEFPEYQWAGWNCTSLCRTCHDGMHDRNTDALTDRGVELLRRTARQRGMEVPMRYE